MGVVFVSKFNIVRNRKDVILSVIDLIYMRFNKILFFLNLFEFECSINCVDFSLLGL